MAAGGGGGGAAAAAAGPRPTQPMTFVAAVFSWLFGDGAPNADFEQRQWEAMADYIRRHGGVVMAAELRPFQISPKLEPSASGADASSSSLDEDAFMLPILQHFDGVAAPSACGEFMHYQFAALASHAHVANANANANANVKNGNGNGKASAKAKKGGSKANTNGNASANESGSLSALDDSDADPLRRFTESPRPYGTARNPAVLPFLMHHFPTQICESLQNTPPTFPNHFCTKLISKIYSKLYVHSHAQHSRPSGNFRSPTTPRSAKSCGSAPSTSRCCCCFPPFARWPASAPITPRTRRWRRLRRWRGRWEVLPLSLLISVFLLGNVPLVFQVHVM